MVKCIEMTGQRFNRLVVLHRGSNDKRNKARWVCRCDCGTVTHEIAGDWLRAGKIQSCGCLNAERRPTLHRTHGATARDSVVKAEYETWTGMIDRCENPKSSVWSYYGGRGIKIAPEWRHDFPAFLAHIGPRPSDQHSIDRIDNDGNYEPGNVRWATRSEQVRNRRPSRRPSRATAAAGKEMVSNV